MYYNQKHKEKIKERKDNYIYIGSYHYREITLDNKNTKNGAIIRVKCPYCSKEHDRVGIVCKKCKKAIWLFT